MTIDIKSVLMRIHNGRKFFSGMCGCLPNDVVVEYIPRQFVESPFGPLFFLKMTEENLQLSRTNWQQYFKDTNKEIVSKMRFLHNVLWSVEVVNPRLIEYILDPTYCDNSRRIKEFWKGDKTHVFNSSAWVADKIKLIECLSDLSFLRE